MVFYFEIPLKLTAKNSVFIVEILLLSLIPDNHEALLRLINSVALILPSIFLSRSITNMRSNWPANSPQFSAHESLQFADVYLKTDTDSSDEGKTGDLENAIHVPYRTTFKLDVLKEEDEDDIWEEISDL